MRTERLLMDGLMIQVDIKTKDNKALWVTCIRDTLMDSEKQTQICIFKNLPKTCNMYSSVTKKSRL